MNARADAGSSGLDTSKLVMSVALVVIGIWAFYFFAGYSLLLRVIGLLVLAGGAAAIALTTHPGRQLWRFAIDARMEVRKVVWPTRQETIQTTLIVMVMVFLLGLLLWLFDMVLMSILRFLTGQEADHGQALVRDSCLFRLRGHVQRSLHERIKRAGMEDAFGDILVPTEEVVEIRNGQQRKSERKFFPGYVLINMEMTDETWHLVKDVPKVMGFIGGRGDRPAPIPDSQADAIPSADAGWGREAASKGALRARRGCSSHRRPLRRLQRCGRRGRLRQERVKVSVLIFGRSTPVELEFSQVEKADHACSIQRA